MVTMTVQRSLAFIANKARHEEVLRAALAEWPLQQNLRPHQIWRQLRVSLA